MLFMKLKVFLLFLTGSLLLCNSYASDLISVKLDIADKPYFGVGDIIYQARLETQKPDAAVFDVKYRFIKITAGAITLRYTYDCEFGLSDFDKKNNSQVMVLNIDENDKAYLRVHQLPKLAREFKVVPKVLVLTVYDKDRGLITVEPFESRKDYSQPQW
jgi:hypothetical protein